MFKIVQVRSSWRRSGFIAEAYDIKILASHDITSKKGFFVLLDLLLRRLCQRLDAFVFIIYLNDIY